MDGPLDLIVQSRSLTKLGLTDAKGPLLRPACPDRQRTGRSDAKPRRTTTVTAINSPAGEICISDMIPI
jgi:hypothetical protein